MVNILPPKLAPLFFILLTLLLLVASLFSLTGKPPVWFDEGVYLHAGRVLADEGIFGVQVAPGQFEDLSFVTAGYPLLMPLAIVIKFFGGSIVTGRLLMVFFILGFAASFFLLAKKLYGANLALASTLLLASFAPLYGNGKSVLGEVPGLFFMTLGLLFLHQIQTAQESYETYRTWKRYAYSLLAGLALGLAASTKPVFLPLAGALLVAVAVQSRFWKQHPRELLNIGIGFAIPLFVWLGTQFSATTNAEHVLAFYTNPYALAAGAVPGLIARNALRFFTESTPVHFALLLAACAVFFAGKVRNKEKIWSSEIAVLVFVVLVLAAYLRTPGWYRYFFTAHVLLFLFLPVACVRIEKIIRSRRFPPVRYLAAILVALLFTAQLAYFIKSEYRYESDTTQPARIYLATIPAERDVLFYNAAELAFLYPHKNFSQYLYFNEGFELGKESLAKLASGGYDVLVMPGSYLRELGSDCYAVAHSARSYVFLTRNPESCPAADVL